MPKTVIDLFVHMAAAMADTASCASSVLPICTSERRESSVAEMRPATANPPSLPIGLLARSSFCTVLLLFNAVQSSLHPSGPTLFPRKQSSFTLHTYDPLEMRSEERDEIAYNVGGRGDE